MPLSFQPTKEKLWDKPSSRKPSSASLKAPLQSGSRAPLHPGRGPGKHPCCPPCSSSHLMQIWEESAAPCESSVVQKLSQADLLAKQDIPVVFLVCSLFPDASDPRDGKSDTESMENMSLDSYRPNPADEGGR